MAHLKRQCQPHVTEAAKTSVEGICTKMYNMACEMAKKISDRHWELLREFNINGKPQIFDDILVNVNEIDIMMLQASGIQICFSICKLLKIFRFYYQKKY